MRGKVVGISSIMLAVCHILSSGCWLLEERKLGILSMPKSGPVPAISVDQTQSMKQAVGRMLPESFACVVFFMVPLAAQDPRLPGFARGLSGSVKSPAAQPRSAPVTTFLRASAASSQEQSLTHPAEFRGPSHRAVAPGLRQVYDQPMVDRHRRGHRNGALPGFA